MNTPVPLTEQLRSAIRMSGRSLRDLSRATQIDVAVLSKFMHGLTGLSLASIDALALTLGLNLTDRPSKFSRSDETKPKGK